ncbi:MAG: type I secretion system permease/ATPase [Burkholderiales bacterium]|nr:MAG: type I secretion system permease/ATPase [Burkholderiales bacterium]
MSATNQPIPGRAPKKELREALSAFRGTFVTVAAFSFFINLMMLTPPMYMLQIYDRVLASRNETTLLMLTFLAIGMYVFMSMLEAVRTFVLVRIGARLDLKMNSRVFNAAFERNLVQPGANAGQSLNDLTTVRQTLTGAALIALFDVPWLPVYLAVIYAFSVNLGVFATMGSVLLIVLALFNERVSRQPLDEAQKLSTRSSQMATNNLRNAEVIEAMGMLPQFRARWQKVHDEFLQKQAKASDLGGLMTGATKFVRISMQSLVLGYGAYETLKGNMTAGMMIAASILIGRALAPVESLIGNWRQLVNARSAYARLTELLNLHPEREVGMPLPQPKGALRIENVSAAPPGTRDLVLRNVDFAVEPGEVIAIIGPSASGKSSLARLIVGVWAPQIGAVRLDGADVAKWNRDELGPFVGYLPQDVELFDGTIAENIARFGNMDPKQVVLAAERTGMHEHILRLPKGYDTPLGEAGSKLSGGQRQRIGLARAIYGEPTIVVLDEPNSNLDDQGEAALVQTVRDLKERGKTVVLITHRMSTLAVADKILLLQEGQVRTFGSRDEILGAVAQQQRAALQQRAVAAAGGAQGAAMQGGEAPGGAAAGGMASGGAASGTSTPGGATTGGTKPVGSTPVGAAAGGAGGGSGQGSGGGAGARTQPAASPVRAPVQVAVPRIASGVLASAVNPDKDAGNKRPPPEAASAA